MAKGGCKSSNDNRIDLSQLIWNPENDPNLKIRFMIVIKELEVSQRKIRASSAYRAFFYPPLLLYETQ